MPSTISNQQIRDALLATNPIWAGSTLTYSIPGSPSFWAGYNVSGEPYHSTFGILNSSQATAFRAAMAVWDAYIDLDFIETSDQGSPGQIRIAFVDIQSFGASADGAAYAVQGSTAQARTGDIWIDRSQVSESFSVGSYNFYLLLHEIGHSLGLKHPFEEGATLPTEWDMTESTVMSYTPPTAHVLWTFALDGTMLRPIPLEIYPISPMLLDVIALQARYGAETVQNGGDSTYAYKQDFNYFYTLRDTSGFDTLDFSLHTRPSSISLIQSTYSSIGYYSRQDQYKYWVSVYPDFATFINSTLNRDDAYTQWNNFSIAPGTVIEKVLAGSGADTVTGSDAGASIFGGAGSDRIMGGNGTNYLRGDDGNDSIIGGTGFDDINGNKGNDTITGGPGGDWLVGGQDNDLITSTGGNDILYGNLGNDTLNGGSGNEVIRGGQGDDVLTGGGGNDWVSGDKGSDTMTGGTGADIFHTFGDAGIDRVTDFRLSEGDRVQLDPGTVYTLSQSGADTLINMTGGGQMILVGVQLSTLTAGWIYGA